MGQKFQLKEEITLDLSDIEKTAKVCRALSSETRLNILKTLVEEPITISQLAEKYYMPMSSMCLHIKTLQEANLIGVQSKPGTRGAGKLCGLVTSDIKVDLFAHANRIVRRPAAYTYMPVGHYCNCEVTPPCGIATAGFYLYQEDSPYGFYAPEHVDASLLWFTSGMLEYHFSNETLKHSEIDYVEFSFEICAEAPGYNNEWPSDIDFELNHKKITTIHERGDYGGRRGIYNPDWWSDTNTQYGDYRIIRVTNYGCYMGDSKVSDENIDSLGLKEGFYFSFILRVDPESEHVGGMNLFGKHFGDYSQDITMKVEYR